jgi:FLYWCH zinc finger domain/Zinc finger, C3HC4 type (RING finger)
MDMQRGEFSTTQRGKKILNYLGYFYNKNKLYKNGDTTLILWECERRREMRCSVYVTTDEEGSVVKRPTSLHIHDEPGPARAAMMNVRHNLLEECQRRPATESAPETTISAECPVCKCGRSDTAIIPCGHCACSSCINVLFGAPSTRGISKTCPVCRSNIRDIMRLHF